MSKKLFIVAVFTCLSAFTPFIAGCAGTRSIPRPQQDNICKLFENNRDWFKQAYSASKRWGIPVPVLMAIMYQESRFNGEARPPRTSCLCILPGPRPSSAYGYAQALDSTWEKYMRVTRNHGADRDDFADAIDFIGWYCHLSTVRCKIKPHDAYSLYLAYHEGHGGYIRNSHRNKPHLLYVARKVQKRAESYSRQYASCAKNLVSSIGCCLWPL